MNKNAVSPVLVILVLFAVFVGLDLIFSLGVLDWIKTNILSLIGL